MPVSPHTLCTAFQGDRRIASGELGERRLARQGGRGQRRRRAPVRRRDQPSIELDFRGTADDVLRRLTAISGDTPPPAAAVPEAPPRGPGRPRLGVVAREVTLLPRHWEWLSRQPGGASVALRKLVEQARRAGDDKEGVRQSQEAAYRFMVAMAGNHPGFEEATRALFAGQGDRFDQVTASWPPDVRDHARGLAAPALRKS